jgi:hypothetical protein
MKKGQSALEFITTYGWALMVILLAGGALWMLVGGGKYLVPESCSFEPGFYCSDFVVEEKSIGLRVKNSMGKDIEHFIMSSDDCLTESFPISFDNGEDSTFLINDCVFQSGEVFSGVLNVDYSFLGSSIDHSKTASVVGIVQADSQAANSSDENTNLLCRFDGTHDCVAGYPPNTISAITESETSFVPGYGGTGSAVLIEATDSLGYERGILNLSRGTAEAQINFGSGTICQGICYIFSHLSSHGNGNKNSLTLYKYNNNWAFYISNGLNGARNILYNYNSLEGWHHFAAVWDKDIDGGYVDFFIDEVKQDPLSPGINKNIADNFPSSHAGVNELGVGYRDSPSGDYGLNLSIDEFKVNDIVRYS